MSIFNDGLTFKLPVPRFLWDKEDENPEGEPKIPAGKYEVTFTSMTGYQFGVDLIDWHPGLTLPYGDQNVTLMSVKGNDEGDKITCLVLFEEATNGWPLVIAVILGALSSLALGAFIISDVKRIFEISGKSVGFALVLGTGALFLGKAKGFLK